MKTKRGLFFLTAAFLLPPATPLLGYLALVVSPVWFVVGLVYCLIGSKGQSRWAMIGACLSFALSLVVTSELWENGGPWYSNETDELSIIMTILLTAGVVSLWIYADSICVLCKNFVLRPLYWRLSAYTLAVAAIMLASLCHRMDPGKASDLWTAPAFRGAPLRPSR